MSVLHLAVVMGKTDVRDFLLERQSCDINAVDMAVKSPLFYAIDNKDTNSVKALLNKGASCV